MKSFTKIGIFGIFSILPGLAIFSGCSTTPTSPGSTPTPVPPTATPVVSNTATHSPTKTPTGTPTNSSTVTPSNTPTGTPTNSPTPSPTSTSTHSPTSTASNTPINTPVFTATDTPTNTPTNTPGGCVPTIQVTYSFSSGTECWSAWGPVTATLSWDTTVYDSAVGSTGSLKVVIPFTDPTQQEQIGLQFGSPGVTISPASNISMYVMASNSANALWVFDDSYPIGTNWDGGGYASGAYTAGTWTQVSNMLLSATNTAIYQFGLQVPGGYPSVGVGESNGSPVTLWIDDVVVP